MEPQEVIPSKNGGPFAYKSPLGWCVVGPLVKDAKKGFISCNRIVVQDVTSGKMASHHFGTTNELKDVSAKQMLQRMYNQEFNESKLAFMEGIGGRLKKSILDKSVTHPIILPKSGKVTEQLIRWCRQKTAHSGRNITLSQIRSSGYWVMQGSSAVKKMISRCVTCRRLRGRVG